MVVPFVDLARDHAPLEQALRSAFDRALASSSFVFGPDVSGFEEAWARWLGVDHVVGVQSGTTALMAALSALGIGPGDEVITVANTFVATVGAIHAVGATPVLVDAEPSGLLLDPGRLEGAIGPRTRAIVPVHLYGQMADMDRILDIAARHSLRVVEDAAQAHGARLGASHAGTVGDAGCFSFYPGKNLGALGEGGAVVTGDPELAERVRKYRNHGGVAKHEHALPGINGRLEALQAAFLQVKLPALEEWNARRRSCAARYAEGLAGLPLELPTVLSGREHVFHLYVVRTPERDRLASWLGEHGVGWGIHYPEAAHRLAGFAGRVRPSGELSVSERLAGQVLSLPMFGTLRDDEVDEVVRIVHEYFAKG